MRWLMLPWEHEVFGLSLLNEVVSKYKISGETCNVYDRQFVRFPIYISYISGEPFRPLIRHGYNGQWGTGVDPPLKTRLISLVWGKGFDKQPVNSKMVYSQMIRLARNP